jgi:hypothetical protein
MASMEDELTLDGAGLNEETLLAILREIAAEASVECK